MRDLLGDSHEIADTNDPLRDGDVIFQESEKRRLRGGPPLGWAVGDDGRDLSPQRSCEWGVNGAAHGVLEKRFMGGHSLSILRPPGGRSLPTGLSVSDGVG